ncbi:PREDICTED: zinc finger protein 860-like [Nicrophorus vespilloides]|uniref:Zinc finger protein 860-like n=1 Tax=Nicrophorus vespilloides TaxID=110193 RepID=A0ABM1MDS0_NICVS|nr:PREDICTED: zinc finger protein 860-like [Nicrophorus vespilloides]
MSTSGFFCSVCAKTYANHSNLRAHVKLHHPDQLNEIAPNKIKYKCEICSESFNNKILFNKHHKVHTSGLKCPLCEVIDVKPALIEHFTLVHNVDINIEHHDFKTIEEFNSWKKQIEEENTVFFPKRHGTFQIC